MQLFLFCQIGNEKAQKKAKITRKRFSTFSDKTNSNVMLNRKIVYF